MDHGPGEEGRLMEAAGAGDGSDFAIGLGLNCCFLARSIVSLCCLEFTWASHTAGTRQNAHES